VEVVVLEGGMVAKGRDADCALVFRLC